MARIVADRVLETSTTTGTGTYTLAGAVTGYRAASSVCANGDTFTYFAEEVNVNGVANGGWEIGLGTWGTGGTLARTTVYSSSNANAAVSWTAGTRRIGLSLVSAASLGNTTITGTVAVSGQTTLDTALSGVAKLTAGVVSTATPGTDFASALQGANADAYRVDQDTYGFMNQTDTTISFVDGTSTFTLAPVSTTFSYYRTGVKITITGSKTVVLPAATATSTMYFIYIDANDGTLTQSTSPWTLNDTKVPVATVTRNSGLTPTFLVSEERHSCKWSRRDHMYEHYTSGTQYSAGGALTGPTVASSTNSAKTCAITAATFFDEDIYETTSAITAGNATTDTFYTVFYRTAVGAWSWQRSLVPFKYTGAAAIEYDNGSGVMTAAGAGGGGATRYVNYYLAVTNVAGQESWAWIPGRAAFTTAALAYAETFSSSSMTGFPCAEIVAIWQFTWDTNGTGLGLCRLNRTPVRINSNIITSTAVTAGSHNGLAGLDGGTAGEYYHATLAEYTGTGTGPFVRQTSPALVTPDVGAATGTSVTLTGGASAATLKSAQQTIAVSTGTTNLDLALYDHFYLNMGINTTLTVTNLAAKIGSSGNILIKQDVAGGRTFTKAAEMKTPLGGATIVQTTTSSTLSVISYYVADASTMIINYIGNFA